MVEKKVDQTSKELADIEDASVLDTNGARYYISDVKSCGLEEENSVESRELILDDRGLVSKEVSSILNSGSDHSSVVEILLEESLLTKEEILSKEVSGLSHDLPFKVYWLSTEQREWLSRKEGKYLLLAKIGGGGQGTLYFAYHVSLGKEVVIKRVSESSANFRRNDRQSERLRLEAKTTASFESVEGLVNVSDSGFFKKIGHYYVMEYIKGISLAEVLKEVLKQGEKIPELTVIDWVIKILDILGKIHEKNIIHRDIKPSNIMIDLEGRLIICDLGLAKLVSGTEISKEEKKSDNKDEQSKKQASLTQTGAVTGTIAYASPEQLGSPVGDWSEIQKNNDGLTITTATDIYSLGVTMYELLTGKRAYQGNGPGGRIENVTNPEHKSQEKLAINKGLMGIVKKMMAKDINKRYQEVSVIKKELLEIRGQILSKIYKKAKEYEKLVKTEQNKEDKREKGDNEVAERRNRYLRKENIEIAFSLYDQAVYRDHIISLRAIINLLELNPFLVTDKNKDRIVFYLKKAYDSGETDLLLKLASIYYEGKLIGKDLNEVIKCYERLLNKAEAPDIKYQAGCIYEERGEGITDLSKAFHMYKGAVDDGYKDAVYKLGRCYFYGLGTEPDCDQALTLFRQCEEKCIEEEKIEVIKALGDLYLEESGLVKENIDKAIRCYKKAGGDRDALFSLGKIYYDLEIDGSNFIESKKHFEQASELGHPGARYYLGNILVKNEQTLNEGLALIKESAALDYPDALVCLARIYESGLFGYKKDDKKSFGYYLQAGKLGCKEAFFPVGYSYFCAKGVDRDYLEAEKWGEKSFMEGDAEGANLLALIHIDKENSKQAKEYFEEAVSRGSAGAAHNLGLAYYNGDVIPKDLKKAGYYLKLYLSGMKCEEGLDEHQIDDLKIISELYIDNNDILGMGEEEGLIWVERAATNGDTKSMIFLGESYELGKNGVLEDYDKALEWYKKPADEGDTQSMYKVGLIYHDGLSAGEEDFDQAFFWFSKAEELGHGLAKAWLGVLYESGLGVERDYTKAYQLYRQLVPEIDFDDKEKLKLLENISDEIKQIVCHRLGWMYFRGNGVKSDYEKAETYFYHAYQCGSIDALVSLGKIICINNSRYSSYLRRNPFNRFYKASELGSGEGYYQLGKLDEESGEIESMVFRYHRASEKGCSNGLYRMGCLFLNDHIKNSSLIDAITGDMNKNKDLQDSLEAFRSKMKIVFINEGNLESHKEEIEISQLSETERIYLLYYLHESAKMGNKKAYYKLSRLCLGKDLKLFAGLSNLPNLTEAGIFFCEKSAKKGFVPAMVCLAKIYYDGDIVPQDKDKSVYWYQRAVCRGDLYALYQLGQLYLKDNNLESKIKAFDCFSRAAESGDLLSMVFLVKMLLNKDSDTELLRARSNHSIDYCLRTIDYAVIDTKDPKNIDSIPQIYKELASLHYEESEIKSFFRSREYYERYIVSVYRDTDGVKGVESGGEIDAETLFRLGDMYWQGLGGERRSEESINLLLRAAELGSLEATLQMGIMYAEGVYFPKDCSLAIDAFTKIKEDIKTCENNETGFLYLEAIFRLGKIYLENPQLIDAKKNAFYYLDSVVDGYMQSNQMEEYFVKELSVEGRRKRWKIFFYTELISEKNRVSIYETDDDTGSIRIADKGEEMIYESEFFEKYLSENKELSKQDKNYMNYSKALYCLGLCYEKGYGIKCDYVKAAELYSISQNGGNIFALYRIALLTEKGKICRKEKDLVKVVYEWLAELLPEAAYRLGMIYEKSGSEYKWKKKAREKYLIAAKRNHIKSMKKLSKMFRSGKGVRKDLEQSKYWETRAKETMNLLKKI